MKLRGTPLSPETRSEDVRLLHAELHQLSYEIPAEEIERSLFGEGTLQAVLDFQRKHGLRPKRVVDEHTAHAINLAVEAHRPIPERFLVHGQVGHQDETPLEGLIVRAFDISGRWR